MTARSRVAVVLVLGACSVASAQDRRGPDPRLDELEKRLDAQQRTLDRQQAKIDEQARRIRELEGRIAPVASGAPAAVASGVTTPPPGLIAALLRAHGGATPRPLGGPANLLSEEHPIGAQQEGVPVETDLHLSFKDNFFIRGKIADEDYELHFNARLHLQYYVYPNDETPRDRFEIRRARFGIWGILGSFRYRIELAPARGETTRNQLPVTHAWVVWEKLHEAEPLFGHFKTPFTLEDGLMSSNWIDFVERPMVVGSGDGVAPHYQPGAEVFGELGEGWLQYWLSVQNPVDGNTVLTGDPLACGRLESDFAGMTLGTALYGVRYGGKFQESFEARTAGRFLWFVPVPVRGWTYAWEADFSFYAGPFWARAEYVWAHQDRDGLGSGGTDARPIRVRGGYITLGWLFCGPPAGSARPRPPFDGWELFDSDVVKLRNKPVVGLELVCRAEYEQFDEDPRGGSLRDFFSGGSSSGSNGFHRKGAWAVTVGFNLDPIESVRFMLDYARVRISDQDSAESRHGRFADELLFRAQIAF